MNRRELRRKRRIRSQIISYMIAVLILAGIAAGIFFGVRHISNAMQKEEHPEETGTAAEPVTEPVEETISAEGETVSAAGEKMQEEPVPLATGEAALEGVVEECIAKMSLEDKVAGLFLIRPEQLTGVGTAVQAKDATRDALGRYPVGGLIYFSKNIRTVEQIREMLSKTAGYSKYPLFLAVDEEGGVVSRVAGALETEDVGPMADIGAGGNEEDARAVGATLAAYLRGYGFNLDFAPVADVLTNPDNRAIGNRSFGSDPELVSRMVAAEVSGLQEGGVSACIKHFPGHGDTGGDSHDGPVETTRTLEEMQTTEFLPFLAGINAGVDMVMVGHIHAPGLPGGGELPASMNENIITGILRQQLGYDGIVITDAMDMSAISKYYAADEAAVKALKAGADMILMPEDFQKAYEGVLAAVREGVIDEERINDSLRRIYRVKYADLLAQGA